MHRTRMVNSRRQAMSRSTPRCRRRRREALQRLGALRGGHMGPAKPWTAMHVRPVSLAAAASSAAGTISSSPGVVARRAVPAPAQMRRVALHCQPTQHAQLTGPTPPDLRCGCPTGIHHSSEPPGLRAPQPHGRVPPRTRPTMLLRRRMAA
jgi:hypothetical protein